MLQEHKYQDAIDLYTKAIDLVGTNAIYYANRAAAYSHINQHQNAIEDCKLSISRNPSYSKAYSRMGLAYYSLGNYEEAVGNYTKALELDPNNASLKDAIETAKKKTNPQSPTPPRNLESMLNDPAMQNFAQQFQNEGQNTPDLSNLLNNPNLMNMAQNVMSQPGFSDMLNNPAMMNMAQSFMQNPQAFQSILKGVFGKDEQQGGQS